MIHNIGNEQSLCANKKHFQSSESNEVNDSTSDCRFCQKLYNNLESRFIRKQSALADEFHKDIVPTFRMKKEIVLNQDKEKMHSFEQ